MKMTKNYKTTREKFDRMKLYPINEAVALVQEMKFAKFDESIDLAINLDVDPRHAEENIRVTTALPHGTGKEVSVLVLASGPKEKEALEAGARLGLSFSSVLIWPAYIPSLNMYPIWTTPINPSIPSGMNMANLAPILRPGENNISL